MKYNPAMCRLIHTPGTFSWRGRGGILK